MCESEAESVLLRARIAELEAALRPFAEVAAGVPGNWPAGVVLTWDERDGECSDAVVNYLPSRVWGGPVVGDYRNAAAVLGEG